MQRYGRFSGIGCSGGLWQLFLYYFFCCRFRSSCFQRAHHCSHPEIQAANEVAAEQMDVWKVLGEKFNMDFEFDNPPQDNYNERLNLVMMDAQLPDIIMDMPTTEVLKYGESGVILSLNDYIENNMPNLKKEIDKRDGVEKALTYSDGNIYYMPMLDEKISGNMPYMSAPTGWKSWALRAP